MVKIMENKSIWKVNVRKNYLEKLNEDITTDILIIGGGISGLSCGYFLRNTKYKITVIEKDMCGFGVTANTTGKLTYVQDLIYDKLQSNFDNDIALKYLNASRDAIRIVKNIVTRNNIDCDLANVSSYVYTNDINKIPNFKKEEAFYKKNNIGYKVLTRLPINIPCKYALKINSGCVFHPVKYVLGLRKILLSSGVKIYEKTKAIELSKRENYYEVKTEGNKILAKKVIVCTHYPFFILPGLIPFKSTVEKSYIVNGKVEKTKNFMAISNEKPTYSIRYHTDKKNSYILYGGSSHSITNHLDIEKRYKEIINDYKKYINKDIKYYFINHDVMTPDSLPYIGRVNANDNNLFMATGFNKWGMTNGTISGKVIADIILNKENPYIELFNPHRKFTKDKIINLIVYNYMNSKSYILTKIKNEYKFYNNNVRVEEINGQKIGIYIDKKNVEHKVFIKCPHMKCNLVFNNVDKTWDCPCHGSRFDIDGNVLFGPSVYNITYK